VYDLDAVMFSSIGTQFLLLFFYQSYEPATPWQIPGSCRDMI